jgi:hypothetical protein
VRTVRLNTATLPPKSALLLQRVPPIASGFGTNHLATQTKHTTNPAVHPAYSKHHGGLTALPRHCHNTLCRSWLIAHTIHFRHGIERRNTKNKLKNQITVELEFDSSKLSTLLLTLAESVPADCILSTQLACDVWIGNIWRAWGTYATPAQY